MIRKFNKKFFLAHLNACKKKHPDDFKYRIERHYPNSIIVSVGYNGKWTTKFIHKDRVDVDWFTGMCKYPKEYILSKIEEDNLKIKRYNECVGKVASLRHINIFLIWLIVVTLCFFIFNK